MELGVDRERLEVLRDRYLSGAALSPGEER